MERTYPLEKADIEAILPHRDPFLWVTRVVSCEPGASIVAELEVPASLDLFRGHFPEYPVLPGVIIMEALAQAASICLLIDRGVEGAIGFLAGIDKAKFRNQVKPGDTITLEAQIVKSSHRLCVAEVKASVGDKLCASATQKYILADSTESAE